MHLEHRVNDLPTPVRHTAHGNLPESCRISSPSPEAMNFVLVMFTWRPLDSNPSFHALTRSTHSSREVAMITRSSAKNSSQGTPTLKSLNKASSTMIKSRGLRTEPWCTPTSTSNSSSLFDQSWKKNEERFLRVGHLLTLTTTLESKIWRMQPSHDVGTNNVKAVLNRGTGLEPVLHTCQ